MFDDYKLNRHRFKELKHFCLQYPEWRMRYDELYGSGKVEKEGILKADFIRAVELIEMTAFDTDPMLSSYILRYVTHDESIRTVDPPCDALIFKYLLNKFYWLLSERKGV